MKLFATRLLMMLLASMMTQAYQQLGRHYPKRLPTRRDLFQKAMIATAVAFIPKESALAAAEDAAKQDKQAAKQDKQAAKRQKEEQEREARRVAEETKKRLAAGRIGRI